MDKLEDITTIGSLMDLYHYVQYNTIQSCSFLINQILQSRLRFRLRPVLPLSLLMI